MTKGERDELMESIKNALNRLYFEPVVNQRRLLVAMEAILEVLQALDVEQLK